MRRSRWFRFWASIAWRLKQITNGYGEITTFDYDPASRVIKKSFANGTYETYSYDSRSRVEWIKLFNSSNQLLSQHQYTYDAASNVLTRTDNGVTTTFGYDDLGQLISESRPGYSASYTYDKNGNRLTRTLNGVTEVYTYDDADKLLNIKVNGVVVKSFTYDMAGRTTGITDSGGTTSLVYDYEDRVTSISRPGMTTNTFAYNGFGARVMKSDSSGTTTYLRSGTSVVAPVVADSGAVYTPGISERRGSASRFYHGDIKNFVEQTDSSGQIVSSQQYDAFGNPVSSTGAWSGPFAYGGRFGYQSDGDYGLKLLGHRYYDPTTGRFLSRDPIGDGRNWYVYVLSNPIRFFDSWGEQAKDAQGTKDGPMGTKYREDLSQKPKPNMHIYDGNREYVINADGSEAARHRGRTLAPMPKKLKKAYRSIIRKFVKKAAKRVPGVGMVFALHTLATEGADAAVREVLMVEEIEAAGGWLRDQGNAFIEDAQGDVEDWYNRRAGFEPGELAEYGLDY